MKKILALFLALSLITNPAFSGTQKLSAITSGGAFNSSTDTFVTVRNGTTDVLTTPSSRSVNVVSTNQTAGAAANTDYVYIVSGTVTITLPTAVGNKNRYTIVNVGTGIVTVATTGGQTINTMNTVAENTQYQSYDFISNNANWNII